MTSRYTHAIVSRVPDVYKEQPTVWGKGKIDLAVARKQHSGLAEAVRGLGLDVLELPPEEANALSIFVQDLAVVVNGIALMCRPANPARKLEVDTLRAVLRKELNQTIAEPESPEALLCGSDVFFTGREFFVGLSTFTNTDGAMAVASTWPDFPCTPIKVEGPLTLRHFLAMAGPDVIGVGTDPQAQRVLKRVERQATHRYQVLTLPANGASNILVINGSMVHTCREEFPKSEAVFSAKVDCPRIPVSVSELQRSEGQRPISALFLLIRKSKQLYKL